MCAHIQSMIVSAFMPAQVASLRLVAFHLLLVASQLLEGDRVLLAGVYLWLVHVQLVARTCTFLCMHIFCGSLMRMRCV